MGASENNLYVAPYDPHYLWYLFQKKLIGASVQSMAKLGDELGYLPVVLHTEDLVFVKKTELEKLYERTGIRLVTDINTIIAKDISTTGCNPFAIKGYDADGSPNLYETHDYCGRYI